MSRLRPLTRSELDDEQVGIWESLIDNRRVGLELVGPDGAMVGPFNAFVHAPKIGKRLSSLGALVRFQTSIERRLSELAICTAGAHWHAEFEFWAHAPMAVEHGVDPAIVEALRAGRPPDFERGDERAVYEVVSQLLDHHRVDAETYAAAEELLGEVGLVELVSTIGYYCLISLTLNLFDVSLPEGAERSWPDR